ncbi:MULTISPECIES: MFS transporter [Pseudoalteromonas]|jgi:fucose permease|uniref:MFS transporter n=1 Tax=Pseudoalteromonas TaxID=53246 RepID=UPI0015D56E7D|nr:MULTISPECIES: MFS transporter [Pseudoalteromonas]QLJ10088.1 MFS transporter [Pseudoalteromonas sp. JSTW]QMW16220.1 MFS transporter [Pseudoalteromonas sp. MT33b]|tara:strand:+ start:11115 stop:12365 length:1251 start_codon:yes stop_codon:yes gene_type:complete
MTPIRITIALACSYFVFAIMLNSVGTVILQAINSLDVSKTNASVLEGYKDLTIAIVSFVVASFIPRLGYKVAMLGALILVAMLCLIVPSIAEFWALKALFAAIGCSFAVMKIAVYSVIGQVTDTANKHSALLNTIEGIFMLGVLSGYWIFALFIDANNPQSSHWLNVYYLLALIIAIAVLAVATAPIKSPPRSNQSQSQVHAFIDMLQLTYQPLVLIFIVSAFLYVLVEQGVGTWLPTFNNQVLKLPVDVSIQLASLFAAALALGRLVAGQLLRFIGWFKLLLSCLIAMAVLVLLILPLTHDVDGSKISSVFDVPFAAYMLPLIGFFMAPIYPLLNSVMLSSLAKHQHAAMTGLIVVFSALGGTTGSIITGFVFDKFSGQHAFYLTLVPIALLLVSVAIFKKLTLKPQYLAASNAC